MDHGSLFLRMKVKYPDDFQNFSPKHTETPESAPPPPAQQAKEPETKPTVFVPGYGKIPAFQENFDWNSVRQPTSSECKELVEEAATALGIENPQTIIGGIKDEDLQRYVEIFVLVLTALGFVAILYRFWKVLTTAPVRQ